MPRRNFASPLFAATLCLLMSSLVSSPVAAQAPSPHVHFIVKAPANLTAPLSGRLLIFLKAGADDKEVDANDMHPASTWVGAREVENFRAGSSVEIDPDAEDIAFPTPFATIPAGNYEVQAVLDVDHTYNYDGRTPADWTSPVVTLAHWAPGEAAPTLELTGHPEETPAHAAALAKAKAAAVPGVAQMERLQSTVLTSFWGQPVFVQAWVILPPGYSSKSKERYPTVYWTHGFGGDIDYALASGIRIRDRMNEGKMPPMIWVMLDESCAQGTHEFANSVNNGPWGTALTTEFIPYLEGKYRMDARATGRFLNGHSSGGWATLQLEVNYPKIFGGTWSTSPDPSDFHNFTGPDLYAANANVYHKADGTAFPLVRVDGKVVATVQQYTQLERVLGPYGGQMASFDWVFSPKSKSGAPEQMFNRTTGDVNPSVVAYWREHYDLAHIVETNWPQLKPDLEGRIHLFVGTADTYYLDGSAHLFEGVLKQVGADPHFTYLPGRSHFDLYFVGKDHGGLFDQISAEMYAVARPKSHWKAPAPAAH